MMFSKSQSNKAVSSECGERKKTKKQKNKTKKHGTGGGGGVDNWFYVNSHFIETEREVEPLATSYIQHSVTKTLSS